jgi:amino acid adenylation domain-containing protein
MNQLAGIEDIYELTALQQGMLFHSQYQPASTVYVVQIDLGVGGALERHLVEGAWAAVLSRHTALRTGFVWERVQRPSQVVHRTVAAPVAWLDWTALDAKQQAEQRRAFIVEDHARPFDLRRPPLVRLTVQCLGPRSARLVLTFHHIVLEGWSTAVLLGDFWRAYGQLAVGQPAALPPALPYAEYLRWLRRRDVVADEAYWRSAMAGLAGPTRLPFDSGADAGPASVRDVQVVTLALSPAEHLGLQGFARSQRLTLNTVLHGVWALVLGRCAGERDLAFGTVVSGRPTDLAGAEGIVGLFVNTLPARVVVDDELSAVAWLQRLQLALAAMREHGHCGLSDVQGWSDIRPGQPLFHSLLAFENWLDTPAVPAAGLSVTGREIHEASDQPLTAFVTFHPALNITLMYDTERFKRPAMERLLGHVHTVLMAVAARPEAQLGEIGILTAAELQQLLVDRNRTTTAYPRERGIGELFAAQAAATPTAVALEQQGRTMDYAELDARSTRLAAHLQALGVGHETPVALMVERSFEMVVGLLGILKAGGAYLPLDPDNTPVRLEFMLADAAAPVLLTQEALRPRLPPYTGRVVALDSDWPTVDASSAPVHSFATGRSLAYLMYTSGSTGRPKGTGIEHRSVVRLVKDTRFMEMGPELVFLQYAPISFDASTLELWGPLLNGGRLVIAPPGLQSLADLGRVIRESGVNALWLTSALFNQMVATQLDSLVQVRQILAGGEAISVQHARRMLDAMAPGACLINGYGPTENTTFTCTYRMTPETVLGDTVPIGRPISNTTVYVLDPRRQPVPVGVWGELYIGGDGLSRGYLHQAELTQRAFVPDPFAGTPGARLYRSGDQVRWNEDGQIEFGGRMDRQVKLFGLRLELGEVEAALRRHPQIQEAAAGVLGELAEVRRLVAWVVGRDGMPPPADQLRAYLRELLPASAVPSAFVVLSSLPLTANGKVDHGALPAPETVAAAEPAPQALPRDEREQRIAAAWSELLKRPVIGLDDNFFDLGGNSLLVMRVHSQLHSNEPSLKVVDLFQYPTVRGLAAHLGSLGALDAGAVPGSETAAADALEERARKRRQAQRRPTRPLPFPSADS